jgi:hypothetical protein
MGSNPWWKLPWLRGLVVAVAWRMFCWASGYPVDGFVCDFPTSDPLPCDNFGKLGGDDE